jgi:hypothetical protein
MVDVETDGPNPGDHSMIALGAVVVESSPQRTFYATLKPISDRWHEDALAVSGFSREQTLLFDSPFYAMRKFDEWLGQLSVRPMFIADNNGFDWSFVNWYFWHFLQKNPFGHSSTNLGSLYKGLVRDLSMNFKHLRKTPHTHNPVDDCMGNVEALLELDQRYNLGILPKGVCKK